MTILKCLWNSLKQVAHLSLSVSICFSLPSYLCDLHKPSCLIPCMCMGSELYGMCVQTAEPTLQTEHNNPLYKSPGSLTLVIDCLVSVGDRSQEATAKLCKLKEFLSHSLSPWIWLIVKILTKVSERQDELPFCYIDDIVPIQSTSPTLQEMPIGVWIRWQFGTKH